MSNPHFSVIIPVHNGADYIATALQSVLMQDYPHFEVLVLENASTDNTVQIVRSLSDSRVRLLPTEQLLPIEENWGRIKTLETREFITFLGHDDLLFPGFLAQMGDSIRAEPQASLYQAQVIIIDESGQSVRPMHLDGGNYSADAFLQAVVDGCEEVCGTGYVMHADKYRQVGGIPALPGLLYADVILWYRLAALGHKHNVMSALAGYRIHERSTHAQYVDLQRYLSATRHYYDFVRTSGVFRQDLVGAHHYIDAMMQLTYRNAASQLAFSGDREQRHRFRKAKAAFAADITFRLTDLPGRVYEMIAALPDPLRRLALLPIRWRRQRAAQQQLARKTLYE